MERIHNKIIKKLSDRYEDIHNLETKNSVLNTRVYDKLTNTSSRMDIELSEHEYPILDCIFENGNKFLMTTKSMYSIFSGVEYQMKYSEFEKSDRAYFYSNKDLADGETRVFRYLSKTEGELFYEIDSLYPADAAHNVILNELIWALNSVPNSH